MKRNIKTASKIHITSRIDILVVFGDNNTVVKARIFERKDGKVVVSPIRPVVHEWHAARKHLLAVARGCFINTKGTGDLIAVPNVGVLLSFLWYEAKTIALGG